MTYQDLAERVESFLCERDIHLTMGGEPTFVPDQPHAPEWNNAAMGEEKLGYARRMTARLLESTYPGALAMQVFGKWYPGEPLPRWNILTLHPKSADPLWPAPERLLLDDVKGGNTHEAAGKFIKRLAKSLGFQDKVQNAREQEGRQTTAWILPLAIADGQWISDQWPYTANRPIKLIGGDSPAGLRLPLSEIPDKHLKLALTVEVRNGALEVFFPPLDWPHFRELVGTMAELADKHDLRDLVFCGYAPEGCGSAVEKFSLAADPGVLEANLPVCHTWTHYDQCLREIYDKAELEGMRAIKLHLNGTIQASGGGSHLAFGGPDAERNPFHRDPAILASILRYWQHHPALSYVFTGQYVGSGCQAPRIDESSPHGVYELEMACRALESAHKPAPDMIDGLLRNLLTDSSGNTHRAEVCMDKFHNYAAPNGKTGIIELRAFEALPTAEQLSLTGLFIRTIIARLIKAPFSQPMTRFGTTLHDKFFLPSALWQDLKGICRELKQYGFPFDVEWLRPIFDFRFPVRGELAIGEHTLSLRQALEAFPLMAEDSSGGPTVRMVDNSTDRLEVTLSDKSLLDEGTLLCNGVEVPFTNIGGKPVAGIRYKCASGYPALHPHVPIQAPLSFHWVDKHEQVVTTGAKYFYWNPHGPIYDGRPQTLEEAAMRSRERWRKLPARESAPEPIKPHLSPEMKLTLDLRQHA